jgi:hypothetical protein
MTWPCLSCCCQTTSPPNSPQKRSQITSRQHVFARSGLKRFVGKWQKLQVLHLATGKVTLHGPDADLFVAIRAWDQRSEARTMGEIERKFGLIAKRIVVGEIPSAKLDKASHQAISSMYSLWRIRHHRACNPLPNLRLNMVSPERAMSQDAMDDGEHHGIIGITPDGLVPGRIMAGPLLQLALDRQASAMSGKRWGIIRAREGEFALPDTFGDYMIMPLSPTCCLIADEGDSSAGLQGVMHLNELARLNANTYIAARNLANCPGL